MDRKGWCARGTATVVFIMVVALIALTAAGCGSSASAGDGPLNLSEADNGKSFTVKAGETVVVSLPGNPTTGFSWAAALSGEDAALLEQIGEPEYVADATDVTVVGSGGKFTFKFKAAAKGEALLKLVYARSWEDVAPQQTFQVTVTVE